MCGQNEPHRMKDCPETIMFMASRTVTINTKGRVIHADGKPLPRGIIGTGGIAKIHKEEASKWKGTSPSIELDQESFLVMNYEFTHLNNSNSEYTIMPVQRDELRNKDNHNQLYHCPESRAQVKKHAESPKENCKNILKNDTCDEPPVRKILQCVTPTQDEDIEMELMAEPAKSKLIPKMKPDTAWMECYFMLVLGWIIVDSWQLPQQYPSIL